MGVLVGLVKGFGNNQKGQWATPEGCQVDGQKLEAREGDQSWNRMMLYGLQSNDDARHRTTLCLCKVVRQFFDQKTTTQPEMMTEIIAICEWYVEWLTVHSLAKPLTARHGLNALQPNRA
jgi:hypothetical protein